MEYADLKPDMIMETITTMEDAISLAKFVHDFRRQQQLSIIYFRPMRSHYYWMKEGHYSEV